MSIVAIFSIFMSAIVVFVSSLRPDHPPVWKGAVILGMLVGGFVACIWVLECFDERRSPEYEWKDWKLRKDSFLVVWRMGWYLALV